MSDELILVFAAFLILSFFESIYLYVCLQNVEDSIEELNRGVKYLYALSRYRGMTGETVPIILFQEPPACLRSKGDENG